MPNCKQMIHPFQSDPGTSQHQRVIEDLLSGPAKIDARALADLLDFFVQLSRHVNYYNKELQTTDWQPFFRKSLPFIITAIVKFDRSATEKKLAAYKKRFERKPSPAGLQLLLCYTYNNIIKPVNTWHGQVFETSIPLETAMEKLIPEKLSGSLKNFIRLANAGSEWYCTKSINFTPFLKNTAWRLENGDLYKIDESFFNEGNTKRKKLIALYNKVFSLTASFLDVIRLFSVAAEKSLDQSLLPLKEEFKESHSPHLAILFSFLKLFKYLQDDLNGFTKKHLDFFYKEILKLKPKEAVPDKLHLVFEIQQQLDQYIIRKGLEFKDGKDNNKAEIFFATEEEIVVNKAQVAEQKTLFINNKTVKRSGNGKCINKTVAEGVYIAPDATRANGIDKDFTDAPASRAALGAKWSKYTDPENKFIYPYPNARLGFVLASPVLLLNEGKRKITITLNCEFEEDFCKTLVPVAPGKSACCDVPALSNNPAQANTLQDAEPASGIYSAVQSAIHHRYYYINRKLIADAAKKGISKHIENKLKSLLSKERKACYCPVEEKQFEITIPESYQWISEQKYYKGDLVRYNNRMYFCMVETDSVVFDIHQWQPDASFVWDEGKQYFAGNIILYNGMVYSCKETHISGTTFDGSKWKADTRYDWKPQYEYKTGNRIFYSGKIYACNQDHLAGEFFDNSKWTENSTGFEWTTGNAYRINDIVFYHGMIYFCRADHTAGTFNHANWQADTPYVWNAGKQYQVNGMCFYEEKLLFCCESHTSGILFDAGKWSEAPYWFMGYEEIFTEQEQLLLHEIIKPRKVLGVSFSGEKEWILPRIKKTDENGSLHISMGELAGNQFTLTITAKLTPDQKEVTFYNAEALKENLNTILPAVKIELDDKIKLKIKSNTCSSEISNCCDRLSDNVTEEVSLYHFFRNVKLLDSSKIDVKVCNVKQLIVQNDESLQDVNSPMFVFGTRPKLNSSFYIGSKELFSKNWTEVWINGEWKDRPQNFFEHYRHYHYKHIPFENGDEYIYEHSFLITTAVLDKGKWRKNAQRRLFKGPITTPPACIASEPAQYYNDTYDYKPNGFTGLSDYKPREDILDPLLPMNISSQYGFLRFTLEGVSFQHDAYPFVLTRQMMAYAELISPELIGKVLQCVREGKSIIQRIITVINQINTSAGDAATRLGSINIPVMTAVQGFLTAALGAVPASGPINRTLARSAINDATNIITVQIIPALTTLATDITFTTGKVNDILQAIVKAADTGQLDLDHLENFGLLKLAGELKNRLESIEDFLKKDDELQDGLPKEPYTPVFKSLSIDYKAQALSNDMDLIHLYPFPGTYKAEKTELKPTLFPTFCDEGTLFIGLKDLKPGSNLNILFQLAEATSDAETERETLQWYYLENNTWKQLRNGFEVLHDDTNSLTTSGIIKFALPANMTNENSILTNGLYWIKATIAGNSKSVSEITGIYTQAIKAVFTNEPSNYKLRLAEPLPAGSVAKLKVADVSVKKITQPFDSFGGRIPEDEGHFYIRTSELLRHKNRAIQKFDYERLILEAFPQLFKVKCINHSYALNAHKFINDFPVAPGHVLIAVIPNLNQLKAARSFEPGAPVSLLEDIETTLKKITSPFVRIRIMNPRYEKVDFCLRIKLLPEKDEAYYKEVIKKDIREFLAPWAVGEYEKLAFGQSVNRSDIIRFLESRDYLDYIVDLKMQHADERKDIKAANEQLQEVNPITPRSILIAGNIDVCIDQQDCEKWCDCASETDHQTKPCCDHDTIPIMNYCKDNPPV